MGFLSQQLPSGSQEYKNPYEYQLQGYNPYEYQSQGYDPFGYQSQGYDPFGYQSQGYDSLSQQAFPTEPRQISRGNYQLALPGSNPGDPILPSGNSFTPRWTTLGNSTTPTNTFTPRWTTQNNSTEDFTSPGDNSLPGNFTTPEDSTVLGDSTAPVSTQNGSETITSQTGDNAGVNANVGIYDVAPFVYSPNTLGQQPDYPMPQESVDPYLSDISTGVNPNFYTQYAEAGAAPLPGAPNLFQYGQAMGPDMGLPQQRNLQTAFNEQGIAQMPVSAGMTGQQAIMSRLQPQLDQQRESLRTQLINQGLRPGDEAYNIAMQQQSQRENDLLSQAALQGLNLDIAANQQGFQQAQARAEFANQALGQQYGMGVTGYQTGLQGLGAYNQAIAANQQSALAQAQMAAQLQEQGFSQAQAMQAAANAAQQQNFANMQTYQQAQNAAAAQAFQQQLAAAQYANAAQQQAYQQAAMIRQMPINEITALMSGSQIANPAFQAYQGAVAQPGDIQAATAQQAAWDQNIYNQKVASRNALMQGLFSLGGAGLGAWGAAAKGCWIAEAIYGVDDPRTHLVRAWLNGPFKATKIGSIVMKLYLKYGERIAEKVKKSKTLKAVLKPLFDMALGCALRDAAKRMLQIA